MRALTTLTFLVAAILLLLHLGRCDVRGGEEGRHAVMARGVRIRPAQFLNPSPEPAGAPGNTPFLYPLLSSVSLRMPGSEEFWLRLPSALATGW